MTEKQPPHVSKNVQSPTACMIPNITAGNHAVALVGEPNDERLYAISKPLGQNSPTGPRCRLSLLERMHNAGIRGIKFESPCSWCQAEVEEVIPKEEN